MATNPMLQLVETLEFFRTANQPFTLENVKAIKDMMAANDHPWQIGKNYLIRTVTMTQTGRLVSVSQYELVLEDAAWIADTGRFSKACETGDFQEVEPWPDGQVIVGRQTIIDACVLNAPLPRTPK